MIGSTTDVPLGPRVPLCDRCGWYIPSDCPCLQPGIRRERLIAQNRRAALAKEGRRLADVRAQQRAEHDLAAALGLLPSS